VSGKEASSQLGTSVTEALEMRELVLGGNASSTEEREIFRDEGLDSCDAMSRGVSYIT
jgi:hypothetical protein